MNAPLFSVVALIYQEGKVLAVSRKDNHEDLGLPGGKIDPGETPEEAVRREVLEETGVVLGRIKPIFDHLDRVEKGQARPCRCFLVESWDGVPEAKETAAVVWVSPDRLLEPSCSFRDYNKALFEALRA